MKIEDFRIEPLKEGRFIHPKLAKFKMDNQERDWEIIQSSDSVAILIYHKQRDAFIFVRQFRPAVYAKNRDGMTLELCAGLVDKDKPLAQIAAEEVEEECGYRVDASALQKVSSFFSAVGFAGSRQTLYFVEVDDSMRVSEGGGIDDERIEVVEIARDKVKDIIYDESIARTPGLMFAILWWFEKNA